MVSNLSGEIRVYFGFLNNFFSPFSLPICDEELENASQEIWFSYQYL